MCHPSELVMRKRLRPTKQKCRSRRLVKSSSVCIPDRTAQLSWVQARGHAREIFKLVHSRLNVPSWSRARLRILSSQPTAVAMQRAHSTCPDRLSGDQLEIFLNLRKVESYSLNRARLSGGTCTIACGCMPSCTLSLSCGSGAPEGGANANDNQGPKWLEPSKMAAEDGLSGRGGLSAIPFQPGPT